MIFTPREYQYLIRDFIHSNQRCMICADMGLGKTASTISALELLWLIGSSLHPALVIAPKRVARDVWPYETQKWDDMQHLRVSAIIGTEAERRAALRRTADIYTINYENIPWLLDVLGSDWPFKIVIADESTRLKGFRLRKGTKRATALSKVAHLTGRWVNLTGTPAPNGLKDMWGQFWFVDFGHALGNSYTAFNERWLETDPYTRAVKLKHEYAERQILDAMRPLTLSVRAKDYFDIKEPIVTQVEFELPPKARRIYNEMEREMFTQLETANVEALNAASKSIKCLQIAAGALYTDEKGTRFEEIHDEKLEALESVIEESSGNPLLVSYWWRHDLARIKKRFPFVRELKTKKDENEWNDGKIRVAAGHPASMGHGLNLQYGCHRICYFTDWWDLELHDQIFGRIGPVRQIQAGFDRPVYQYNLVARDTVEELVQYRHADKTETQDLLLDYMRRKAA